MRESWNTKKKGTTMKKLLIAAGVAGLLAATPVLAQDVTTAIPADKTQTPQAENVSEVITVKNSTTTK